MDFVTFLNFLVKCIDVLAWPLLALVYPLWASIRAIESDSSSDHPKKLVAYWILFSLIFLFEYAFADLLEGFPFWHYMKLIISCCLVIPNFDGAFYVYEQFIRPCLFKDKKVLMNQFEEREELSPMGENFAAEIKKYVKEKGPETLEFASKVQSTNFVEKNEKEVEAAEKKDVEAAKQVNLTETGIAQTENKKLAQEKYEEISETVAGVTEFSHIPVSMRVQKEWTCALCQVRTQSEISLNSHLRGKRHKTTCEEMMNGKNQQSKTKSEEMNEKNQQSKTKVSPDSDVKRSASPAAKQPENQASTSRRKRRSKKLQGQPEKMKYKCVEFKDSLWWCTICNRSCNSKQNMDCHLYGKKHLAQAAQLKGGS